MSLGIELLVADVVQHELEELGDARVGQAVVAMAFGLAFGDQAFSSQGLKLVRGGGHALAQVFSQAGDARFAVLLALQQAQSLKRSRCPEQARCADEELVGHVAVSWLLVCEATAHDTTIVHEMMKYARVSGADCKRGTGRIPGRQSPAHEQIGDWNCCTSVPEYPGAPPAVAGGSRPATRWPASAGRPEEAGH